MTNQEILGTLIMPHRLTLQYHLQSIEAGMLIHLEHNLLWIMLEVYLMMRDILEIWILILPEEGKGIEIYHLGHKNMDKRESSILQITWILTWMIIGYIRSRTTINCRPRIRDT